MANTYIDQLTATWANNSNAYSAISMNVTDGGSLANSKLIVLKVGSTDKFSVDKSGNVVANNLSIGGITSTGIVQGGYTFFQSKTTDFTLSNTDSGSFISVSNTANVTCTVPNTLPSGFCVGVVQVGAGQVIFSNAAGITINHNAGGTTTANQYSAVSLFVYESGNSVLLGSLV